LGYMGSNKLKMSTLYVVATPIGNLEDITLRALRILGQVKLIAAEDTRATRHLLKTHGIKTPLTSYHEHNKMTKLSFILEQMQDGDIALVSEAGMPGVNDPGYELIVAAIQQGITVTPVPGPSSIITALAVSGLPTDRFLFIGFLPRKKGQRRKLLESLVDEQATIIALEAPHRIRQSLNDLTEVLGERRVAVCRELTKIYEEIFRGTLSQAYQHFSEPRGEFTLVIEGNRQQKPPAEDEIIAALKRLRRKGVLGKEAVARVANQNGLSKREVYKLWLRICAENDD
jgi:16S rRNA (cytidine1402-2'-O)-methyltransferase